MVPSRRFMPGRRKVFVAARRRSTVVDVIDVVVVGTILGVALILALLAWRTVRAFREGARMDDETE